MSTESVINNLQGEFLANGIYESYRHDLSASARLFEHSKSSKMYSYRMSSIAAAMRQAVRAELPLVPVVKHGNCEQCLYLGRLATDQSEILIHSTVRVSVDREDAAAITSDTFTVQQFEFLREKTKELQDLDITFAVR